MTDERGNDVPVVPAMTEDEAPMGENEFVCPGCVANDIAEECCHDGKTWALAEALSVGLPGGPATWGTPVERAWAFIDDAEALNGDVGAPPYMVTMFHPDGRPPFSTVGLVNGRYLFAVPDDGEAEFIGDVWDGDGRARLVMPDFKAAEVRA